MVQSSQQVWPAADAKFLLLRRQISLNPVWLSGLWSLATLALSHRPFGISTRALTAHPPNWIQTNLATNQETKVVA
ncbi:MAG: hypothetical protein GY696_40120 [Gammaproteobacteria bacterium]|nr:hypothetical protein [Gammaproteobacteria bacterium]